MNTYGGCPLNILVFDGSNWEKISSLMKSLFGDREGLEMMHNGYEELGARLIDMQRATFNESKKKDNKACSIFKKMKRSQKW